MPNPPTLPPALPPVLSQEQLQQLAAARLAGKKVQRVAGVAKVDGWTIAIFAAVSFVSGLGSVSGVAMGLGMGVIAGVELMGAARLRRLDAQAARMLGFNQLAFAALLVLYAAWSLYGEFHGSGMFASLAASDPSVKDMLKDFEPLARTIALAMYGSLMVVALAGQGGMALYYFSRIKHIQDYVQQTPAWIIQMQQTLGG